MGQAALRLHLRSSPGPKDRCCRRVLWCFPKDGAIFFDFWVSPQETFALFRWLDQSEFGFERVAITPEGLAQDISASYFCEGTAEVTDPVFSPNGRLWACAYKIDEVWWAADPENPDPEQPARGGEYTIGALLIFAEQKQPPRSIPLVATVPPGWLPQDPLSEDVLVIADPLFLDEQRIQLRLPSGEVQIHAL